MIYLQTFENFTNTKTYVYSYNCVSPKSYDELIGIIENMREITSATFFKHVDMNDFEYTKKELINDYHVRYYRSSKFDAYIIKHSAIEYVFKNTVEKKEHEKTKKEKVAAYKLLKTYKNHNVGDNIENFGKITKIFSYPNGQVQFEIDRKRYCDSSYFE